MQKLYQKSEIWFAVVWIIVYVVWTSYADQLSDRLGVVKSVTAALHVALCLLALAWMVEHGLTRKYGLCKPNASAAKFLFYLPLIGIASCNLWLGVSCQLPPLEAALYVLSMICVGFLEELIFRGFLFEAMRRDNLKSAVIVSSLTFGIGHVVNLFNGSGADVLATLCQMGYAVAFGFLFVVIFYRSGSLLPCIAAHSAINALSVFADEASRTTGNTIVISVVLTAAAVLYLLVLLRTLPAPER